MKARVLVGIALSLMLVVALVLGGYFLLCIITFVSLASVFEIGRVSIGKGGNPILIPAYVFAACYVFLYLNYGFWPMVLLYVACVLATMTTAVVQEKCTANDAVFSLFIFCYPLALLICVMLVYFSFDRVAGLTAASLAYAAPSLSDTFAYFGGTLFGKKKLCPHLSPKKTVEGSVFALIGGTVFGLILIPLQKLWGSAISPYALVFTGFLCGIFSQIGDLFASKLKRWADLKDFSSIFPGHGGIMDRIDSVLVCAPIVLLVFTILRGIGIY